MEKKINYSRTVVISAVNFNEGGPLTILRECLSEASARLDHTWRIIAYVHDRSLINEPRVTFFEVPYAKRSWLARLYCEWFYFSRLSKSIQPDLWISLHDITPRVTARRQVVYCHNPSPFYKLSLREACIEPKFAIFNIFYKYVYLAFARRNSWIIVQQEWLRIEFRKWFGLLPIVVAHPVINEPVSCLRNDQDRRKVIFFYPALPRVFKNIETLLAAAKLLSSTTNLEFELRITIDGNENRYAKILLQTYRNLKVAKFIGRQTRLQMSEQYAQASAVLFPSKLETWGLPISEAKSWNKALLVSDLPYAHESVGNYDKAQFLPAESVTAWAVAMASIIEGTWSPMAAEVKPPNFPYTRNWTELLDLLILDL